MNCSFWAWAADANANPAAAIDAAWDYAAAGISALNVSIDSLDPVGDHARLAGHVLDCLGNRAQIAHAEVDDGDHGPAVAHARKPAAGSCTRNGVVGVRSSGRPAAAAASSAESA